MSAPASLAEAIEEIQLIVSADGARFDVVPEDDADVVHLRLELEEASCADCVLPHDRLVDVVETSLRRRTGNDAIVVRIDDPRSAS
jgi:hypothetical protein